MLVGLLALKNTLVFVWNLSLVTAAHRANSILPQSLGWLAFAYSLLWVSRKAREGWLLPGLPVPVSWRSCCVPMAMELPGVDVDLLPSLRSSGVRGGADWCKPGSNRNGTFLWWSGDGGHYIVAQLGNTRITFNFFSFVLLLWVVSVAFSSVPQISGIS